MLGIADHDLESKVVDYILVARGRVPERNTARLVLLVLTTVEAQSSRNLSVPGDTEGTVCPRAERILVLEVGTLLK